MLLCVHTHEHWVSKFFGPHVVTFMIYFIYLFFDASEKDHQRRSSIHPQPSRHSD